MAFSIGSLAGGLSQGLSPWVQSLQQNAGSNAAGQVLQQLYGGGQQQQPQSLLPSILAKLTQSAQPQQQQPAPMPQAPQPQQGGFQNALKFTMGQEGGLNPSDTNNTPTNMGINAAANPGVDIQNLTPDQAAGIYKTNYWDKIGGDALPPALQTMAFDTAAMAGVDQAKAMLRASNGDPQKFMQLRQAFQSKLLSADPQKYGKYAQAWAKRNAALMQQAGAPSADAPQGGQGAPPSLDLLKQLTLPQIVQAAQRTNPNIRGAQLMAIIDRLTPMMNAQALSQYRQFQEQIGYGKLTEGQERITNQADQFRERMDTRSGEFDRTMQERYDALKQAKSIKDRDFARKEAEDAIKDELAARRNEIQANSVNITGDQAQRLQAEAARDADAAIKRLDDATKDWQAPKAASEAPKQSSKPAPEKAAPAGLIAQAKAAIAQGAPRDKVIAKLKAAGYGAEGI